MSLNDLVKELVKEQLEAIKAQVYVKVYFDMDGVLADFEGSVHKDPRVVQAEKILNDLLQQEPDLAQLHNDDLRDALRGPQEDPLRKKIKKAFNQYRELSFAVASKPGHFLNLDMLPGVHQMLNVAAKLSGKLPDILTAPMESNPRCEEEKFDWVLKNLNGLFDEFHCTQNKDHFAHSKFDILIDDRPKYVNKFRAAGGTAILHTEPSKTIKELEEIVDSLKSELLGESKAGKGKTVYYAWHITPEKNLDFRRKGKYSKKFDKRGIFVAPDYESIARSWAAWVNFAKARTRDKYPDFDPRDPSQAYRTMYLYKIAVPRDVYERATKEYDTRASAAGPEGYGAWGWDLEYFIPEEDFPKLKVIGRKERSWYDFQDDEKRRNSASFTGSTAAWKREREQEEKRKNRELDEFSAMGTGAVVGYTLPLGMKPDYKKLGTAGNKKKRPHRWYDTKKETAGVNEEYLGSKGGLSYFQIGGSLPDRLYNLDKDGKPTRDPGVPGLTKKKRKKKKTVKEEIKKDLVFYHGSSRSFAPGDYILPPEKTGKISEKGRKKNLNKVFFTLDKGSAKIYAGRAVQSLGGEPHVYVVEPEGEISWLNQAKGTTVAMAPIARVIREV